MNAKKSVSMKALVLLLAAVLLFGCAAGGTLAWLVTKSATVTNTFTTSDINIKLEETKKDFKMVPGADIAKDPKVTVLANSEDCYVYVKIEKTANFDTYMTYAVADGWTTVETGTNEETDTNYVVIGRTAQADETFDILQDNVVHVLDSVTKAMMETAKTAAPTLTFTAYAIQKQGFESVEAAWDEAKKLG
jgi:hypothetical protein